MLGVNSQKPLVSKFMKSDHSSDPNLRLLLRGLEQEPSDTEARKYVVRALLDSGERDLAERILAEAPQVPEEEAEQLEWATLWLEMNPDRALELADAILIVNKACAAAYRIKATVFHRRGDVPAAQKFESVADVIEESEGSKLPPLTKDPPESDDERILVGREGDELTEQELMVAQDFLDSLAPQKNVPTFAKIGGMDALKERIRLNIILPFLKPELAAKYGKRAGGGMLLYGPPGCGKTLLAQAAAGESGVPFFSLEIPEVLSKWLGESEQRIHQFFEAARAQAPAIVFLDEIDALGGKRSEMSGGMSTLVNVLLTEIDGATSRNDGLLILGATNMPWRVDAAFRRPGRFDRILFVPPPDEPARAAILQMFLKGLPAKNPDISKLARSTAKFSGADLRFLVDQAAEAAMLEDIKTGKEKPIDTKDLLAVIQKMRPSTLEWLEQASNYASFANTTGLYDDLAEYLKQR